MPEGIVRKHLYEVFGSRSEYLAAPEDEALEQRLIWEGENEAAKIQRERDAVERKRIEAKVDAANKPK